MKTKGRLRGAPAVLIWGGLEHNVCAKLDLTRRSRTGRGLTKGQTLDAEALRIVLPSIQDGERRMVRRVNRLALNGQPHTLGNRDVLVDGKINVEPMRAIDIRRRTHHPRK